MNPFWPFLTIVCIFIIILLPLCAKADEVMLGSLTYHVLVDPHAATQFSNQMSSDGRLISNLLLGYRRVHLDNDEGYYTIAAFGGENSVAQPMFGAAASTGLVFGSARLGVVAGAYLQDNDKFIEKGITPVTIMPHPGWGLSPVLGVEYTKKVYRSVFVNSLLSPVICNFSIGWEI